MVTKGYGLTLHDIDWSCPTDLEPYAKAYALERKEKDALVHMWIGSYGVNALMLSLDRAFNGRKSSVKYAEKPIISKIEEEKRPLTESEIERQRAMFVEKLKLKKANFDLHHKNKNKDSTV